MYRFLPFEWYLKGLSRMYFASFYSGALKNNRLYAYPYFLREIVASGDTCLDIGANLGYITVPLSRLVGPAGQVHAVEPVRPILSVLKSNTRKLKNVQIYPYALGEEEKVIKLGNNTKHEKGFVASGSNFILDKKIGHEGSADVEFEAEMKIGSRLFAGLAKLDFLKCDIEGYETVVIPELKLLITRFEPIVLIETTGQGRIQMMDFFTQLGYRGFVLEEGRLRPAQAKEYWDILFVPPSRMGKVQAFLA